MSDRYGLTTLVVWVGAVAVLAGCGLSTPSLTRAATTTHASPTSETGIVTGAILLGGGPAPPHDKRGHAVPVPVPGEVTVFTAGGKPVIHTRLHNGQHFSLTLPAGHYLLNSGSQLYNKFEQCKAVRAVVHPHQTVHVNVSMHCSVP